MPRPTNDRSPSRPLSKGGRPVLRKEWPRHMKPKGKWQTRRQSPQPCAARPQACCSSVVAPGSAWPSKVTARLIWARHTQPQGSSPCRLHIGWKVTCWAAQAAEVPKCRLLCSEYATAADSLPRAPRTSNRWGAVMAKSNAGGWPRNEGRNTSAGRRWLLLTSSGLWGRNKPDFSRSGRRQARSAQR